MKEMFFNSKTLKCNTSTRSPFHAPYASTFPFMIPGFELFSIKERHIRFLFVLYENVKKKKLERSFCYL